MNTFHFLETDIPEKIRLDYLSSKEFKKDLILQNIRRGKLLAILIVTIEVIVSLIDIVSYLQF
jgi:hypothetical protein